MEAIIVTLTLWVQNNKGCGSEEACLHLSDSVIEDWNYLLFSHFYVLASLRKISLISLLFNFFVLYLSISPLPNQSPGEDITFSVCERTIISVNFILSRPCCH